MRDSHRAEAERLLGRAVEEEVRRSGGRTDGGVLLTRARGALDTMAQSSAEEYAAYTRALDEAKAGQLTFGQRYAREGAGTPLLVAAVAAFAAGIADLALGTGAGTAMGAALTVGVVGAAATVLKVTASHLPAAHHRAGAVSQPGGPEQLRLTWLTALEVRGIRPFLDQQRVLSASTGPKKSGPEAARQRQERGGPHAQRPRAVVRPTPRPGRPVRGPATGTGPHPAVGARGPGEHGDPADPGRPARRVRQWPQRARRPRGARSAGPVPGRVRGGSARRQPEGAAAAHPRRPAAPPEPARRLPRAVALP